METILLIDDDMELCTILQGYLARYGFEVITENSGDAGLQRALGGGFAMVLLDVMLPGLDGFEVLRRLRATSQVSVLLLTARGEDIDRIVGLEIGGDDYLSKPFSPRELVARVTSVLRRSQGSPGDQVNLEVGDVRLDPAQRRVFVGGDEVELTATEFDLLCYLMRRPGQVFAREQLISEVWGYSSAGGVRTVDVHIAQVRFKLGEASPIRTVRGVGYAVSNPAPHGPRAADGSR